MSQNIDTIIFDLGGVLIDWNPRYLYRKIFSSEEEIEWFLANVCTSEWNDEQDAGRSFAEATESLARQFPAYREPIEAWYARWTETVSGPIHGTVEILREIRDSGKFRLYALTNWSAETFPWAMDNFEFLHWFEGIVVSGIEKCRKPLPGFFKVLFDRYKVVPERSLFIDDNHANIKGAKALNLNTITFQHPQQLIEELRQWNVHVSKGLNKEKTK